MNPCDGFSWSGHNGPSLAYLAFLHWRPEVEFDNRHCHGNGSQEFDIFDEYGEVLLT